MKKIECCQNEVKVKKQGDVFVYRCGTCGKQSEGKTPAEAVEKWGSLFDGEKLPEHKFPKYNGISTSYPNLNIEVIQKPTSPANIEQWADQHLPELIKKSASFQDKPATQRMIKKNIDYVANHKELTKKGLWNTEEGQQSIVAALEESFWMGAMMPEMGSIVVFNKTCEFIPAVEAFNYALTTGNNPPFKKIEIIIIHEKDIYNIGRKDGQFYCTIQQGFPRGNAIGVVVMAERIDGVTIGESYDVGRLMEKAKKHSASYKAYLNEMNLFNVARTEGKVKKEGKREYFINPVEKADGTIWNKRVYLDELTTPYEGADQPEMLRKSAGKSFLNPYMKIRNSMSMAGEWDETSEGTNKENLSVEEKVDDILQTAKENVSHAEEIKEAEIIQEDDRI